MHKIILPVLRPVCFAATLALSVQSVTADEGATFDCNRLNNSIAEIFTGITQPQPVLVNAFSLKKGAILVTDQRALTYKKYRIANDAMASRKTDTNPTIFREYMVVAEMRFCTPEKRKDLVRKYRGRYRLHCLVDDDGDGAYEAIVPTGQIVRFNRLTGKNVANPYPQPAPTPLSSPVTLVEDASLIVPDANLQPHVNIKYMIDKVDENTASLVINSAISMLPDEDKFFNWADETRMSVSLDDIAPQTAGSAKLQIASDDKKRIITVSAYTPVPVTLQCDGTIITLPGSFTLLYPDGQAVLKY